MNNSDAQTFFCVLFFLYVLMFFFMLICWLVAPCSYLALFTYWKIFIITTYLSHGAAGLLWSKPGFKSKPVFVFYVFRTLGRQSVCLSKPQYSVLYRQWVLCLFVSAYKCTHRCYCKLVFCNHPIFSPLQCGSNGIHSQGGDEQVLGQKFEIKPTHVSPCHHLQVCTAYLLVSTQCCSDVTQLK